MRKNTTKFSHTLRKHLKLAQMNQRELARAVNLSDAAISKYVRGHSVPRPCILRRISLELWGRRRKAFNNPEDIFDELSRAVHQTGIADSAFDMYLAILRKQLLAALKKIGLRFQTLWEHGLSPPDAVVEGNIRIAVTCLPDCEEARLHRMADELTGWVINSQFHHLLVVMMGPSFWGLPGRLRSGLVTVCPCDQIEFHIEQINSDERIPVLIRRTDKKRVRELLSEMEFPPPELDARTSKLLLPGFDLLYEDMRKAKLQKIKKDGLISPRFF